MMTYMVENYAESTEKAKFGNSFGKRWRLEILCDTNLDVGDDIDAALDRLLWYRCNELDCRPGLGLFMSGDRAPR